MEVRLPPLNHKTSAKLTLLVAGGGSLFAGPANSGGLLQWGSAEGVLRLPGTPLPAPGSRPSSARALQRLDSDLRATHEESAAGVAYEDSDAAPCFEAAVVPRKYVTALAVDEAGGVLWVGDREGVVSGFALLPGGGGVGLAGDNPGDDDDALRPDRLIHRWHAHRLAHVTALCVAPSGEVWTGSARGNVRAWALGRPGSATTDCGALRVVVISLWGRGQGGMGEAKPVLVGGNRVFAALLCYLPTSLPLLPGAPFPPPRAQSRRGAGSCGSRTGSGRTRPRCSTSPPPPTGSWCGLPRPRASSSGTPAAAPFWGFSAAWWPASATAPPPTWPPPRRTLPCSTGCPRLGAWTRTASPAGCCAGRRRRSGGACAASRRPGPRRQTTL